MKITHKKIEDSEKICYTPANRTMNSNLRDWKINIHAFSNRVAILIHITNATLTKKCLIDGIRTGLKYVFGTMDSDDADDIAFALDNVYNYSSNKILLIKKQTTMV